MFTPLDNELFPEDCRVVHMPLCDQWIYWIQKNGTSSLRKECKLNNLNLYRNEEIKELSTVDIYIRDAESRYISGISTFVEFTLRDNPSLNKETAIWFAKKYKFLNRHYLPQFFWLLNLSRYLDRDCVLRFHDFENFNSVTQFNVIPTTWSVDDDFKEKILKDNHNMALWFFVDQILKDLSGQSLTWDQLIQHYRLQHNETWNLLISNSLPLIENVLPQT